MTDYGLGIFGIGSFVECSKAFCLWQGFWERQDVPIGFIRARQCRPRACLGPHDSGVRTSPAVSWWAEGPARAMAKGRPYRDPAPAADGQRSPLPEVRPARFQRCHGLDRPGAQGCAEIVDLAVCGGCGVGAQRPNCHPGRTDGRPGTLGNRLESAAADGWPRGPMSRLCAAFRP